MQRGDELVGTERPERLVLAHRHGSQVSAGELRFALTSVRAYQMEKPF